jgi:hypothetical protein
MGVILWELDERQARKEYARQQWNNAPNLTPNAPIALSAVRLI